MLILGFRLSLVPSVYPSPYANEVPGAYSSESVPVRKKTYNPVGLEN
jgi:hypothetical protein